MQSVYPRIGALHSQKLFYDRCAEPRHAAARLLERTILFAAAVVMLAAPFLVIASSAGNFNRDLTIGSRGDDVKALQVKLSSLGYLKAAPAAYFGNMTQNALANWQKDAGITPATGYFGPKSRAEFSAAANSFLPSMASAPMPLLASVPTSTAYAPTSSLRVALSALNPPAGVLISNTDVAASRVPVLGVTFAAGTKSDITVQELKFHKTGTLSDISVADAYIIQGDKVVVSYTSMNGGIIRFTGLNVSVPAGQTQTLWLAIDPANGLNPGNMASFALVSAADIIATNASGSAAIASGEFPINGNSFRTTSVSNPSLASLAVSPLSIGTNIVPPSLSRLVASWNFFVNNSKLLLNGLKLFQSGVADPSATQNLKLFVNGAQAVATVPALDGGGNVYFDASDKPVILRTGSNNIQVYADVVGSPTYDVQFQIFNPYDIFAVDSQYGVPIHGSADPGTDISIQGVTLIVNTAR